MVGNLLIRSQSKYATIHQYLQLGVTVKGQTVKEALDELEEVLGQTDNIAAHENVADTREVFNDIVADGILDNDTPMAQSIILIKLELRLNEKTIYGDYASDGGTAITSTRD